MGRSIDTENSSNFRRWSVVLAEQGVTPDYDRRRRLSRARTTLIMTIATYLLNLSNRHENDQFVAKKSPKNTDGLNSF